MKLLLIEDEKSLADSILAYLRTEGYLCELAATFEAALEKIHLYAYDCMIVDITLPDGNGLELIQQLKKNSIGSGIIIISARNSLEDRITGLDSGSDDYLTKPFHLSELNARIKSIIRRRNFQGNSKVLFHELTIIPDQQQAFVHQTELQLTRKEFDLLLYFVANRSRVLTKESIVEHLWGDDSEMLDSFDFLYTHIKNLRKKILEKGGQDYIQSVYGIGYKFTNSVSLPHS